MACNQATRESTLQIDHCRQEPLKRLKDIVTTESLANIEYKIEEKLRELASELESVQRDIRSLQQAKQACINSCNANEASLEKAKGELDKAKKKRKHAMMGTFALTFGVTIGLLYAPTLAVTIPLVIAAFTGVRAAFAHREVDHCRTTILSIGESNVAENELIKIVSRINECNEKHEEVTNSIKVMQRAANIINVTIEGKDPTAAINEDTITVNAIAAIEAISITTKQLECSQIIHSYLTLKVFEQPSAESKSFITSLPVQVSINEVNLIQLKGTPVAIRKGEKLLMSHFVPPHCTFEFTNDIRFFSLIEKFILAKQYEKDSTFYYLQASAKTNSSKSSPDKAGFSFTIFSSHAEHFEQVCSDLKNLQPHTKEILVHFSFLDYLKRRKEEIEHKHSVRLRLIIKLYEVHVYIDGLQKVNVVNCQKELKQTTRRKMCLTGFQIAYLDQKLQPKIVEFIKFRNDIWSLQAIQKFLNDTYFIPVNGNSTDVECVNKNLDEILRVDMKQDTASIECACSVLVFWVERWKNVVADFKTHHDIFVWFDNSSSPQISGWPRKQACDDHDMLNKVVITFVLYGKAAIVDMLKNLLVKIENGGVIEKEISQPVDVCQALRDAITKQTVGIHDLSVQVRFPQSNTILLLAPSCKRRHFAAALQKIDQFIDEMVRREVVILCHDKAMALILNERPHLLKEALPSDLRKKIDVLFCPPARIQLTGSQVDIETAKFRIGICLSKIRASLSSAEVLVDSLSKPYFFTKQYCHLCSHLELNKQVLLACPFLNQQISSNAIIFQTSFKPCLDSLCVQLTLVCGNIYKEEVDVIVDPSNPKLVEERFQLYSVVNNSLCVANRKNLQSIALPAIVPITTWAEESHHAVRNFCIYHPRACVKDIRFVFCTETDAQEFLTCFEKLFTKAKESGELCIPSVLPQASATVQSLSAAAEQSLYWLWESDTDSHHFSLYDSSKSKILTQMYRSNPYQLFFICIDAKWYHIDLSTMQQTNMVSGKSRKIQVEEDMLEVTLEEPFCLRVQWRYRDCQASHSIKLRINRQTGCECSVRQHRQVVDDKDGAVATLSSEQLSVNLRGPTENLKKAIKELEEELCSCLRTVEIRLSKVPSSTEHSLKEVAKQHCVQVTFSSKERTATIKGYGDAIDNAFIEMQKLVPPKISEDEIEIPLEWEPQEENLKLVYVSQSNREWHKVSAKFRSTMPRTTLKSIQRIQNKWLWKKYAQHRKMIEEKNGGSGNEKELFHGTGRNMPQKIYESEEGFDMRFCDQGMWGIANYFAVDASYSNKYAYRHGVHRKMFLVKVLTGRSRCLNPDNKLRMPPKIASLGSQLGQAMYDTVNGITNGSQVYMTYDNQKAYPAYLITYCNL